MMHAPRREEERTLRSGEADDRAERAGCGGTAMDARMGHERTGERRILGPRRFVVFLQFQVFQQSLKSLLIFSLVTPVAEIADVSFSP